MIQPTLASFRLFLHVLAASVWVGGQIVLGGLVPRVRRTNPEALKPIANAFGRVAWPAFGFAVVTGVWNLLALDPAEQGSAWMITLAVKLALVAAAAIAVLVHSHSSTRLGLALGGAIGLLASLAALWFGILLAGAA